MSGGRRVMYGASLPPWGTDRDDAVGYAKLPMPANRGMEYHEAEPTWNPAETGRPSGPAPRYISAEPWGTSLTPKQQPTNVRRDPVPWAREFDVAGPEPSRAEQFQGLGMAKSLGTKVHETSLLNGGGKKHLIPHVKKNEMTRSAEQHALKETLEWQIDYNQRLKKAVKEHEREEDIRLMNVRSTVPGGIFGGIN